MGNLCGVIMGLLAAAALMVHSFALFCLAMLFGGAYASIVLTFRFAATECVEPSLRPRAISTVMAGGVAAGVVGPQMVTLTMNAWAEHAYVVTYLAAAVVAALSGMVLAGGNFQQQTRTRAEGGRRTADIIRQPQLAVAMLCGLVTYMMMNFMMTSAPLAMDLCGIPRADANFGIEMHLMAMYAPSFFTGRLISRFGAPRIILSGLGLIAIAALTGMSGMTVDHFWLSLVLLGLGWNFGWVGASALVVANHRPEEGARVQSVNDFFVFGSMVLGSFVSGSLLATFGWKLVSTLMLGPLLLAALALLWLRFRGQETAPCST